MKCANLAFVVTPPRRFPKAVTAISPAWREQYHSATAWAMGRAEDASALCSPSEHLAEALEKIQPEAGADTSRDFTTLFTQQQKMKSQKAG